MDHPIAQWNQERQEMLNNAINAPDPYRIIRRLRLACHHSVAPTLLKMEEY